jgi:hypothetical protein
MIKLSKRGIAALAVTASALLLGTAIPASAATGTDGFTILYADYGDSAHHCTVVGTPVDGYEAVVCADIITSEVDSSDYDAYGQIEAYCQTTKGVMVECAQIYAYNQFYSASGDAFTGGDLICGHASGACSSGRNEISTMNEGEIHYTSNSGCSSEPDSDHDVWTEVLAGTAIELPVSDHKVLVESGSGANDGNSFTSGHYYVCA